MKGAITCGVVITIALLVVILAFTVLKPQELVSKVDDITIQHMDVSFDIFKASINMNVTLDINVSVKNPNKFDLKYNDGIALVNYRGQLIGEAPIPDGEILVGETKKVNVALTLMADRLLKHPQITSDITSNRLPLNTHMRIFGEVNILGIIKFHAESTSTCDFNINISGKTIENKVCQHKTKI